MERASRQAYPRSAEPHAVCSTRDRGHQQGECLLLPRPASLVDQDPQVLDSPPHVVAADEVNPRHQDRRLHHGMGRTVEPKERPDGVLSHHPRRNLKPLLRVIDRVHGQLPGMAGVEQHPAGHGGSGS